MSPSGTKIEAAAVWHGGLPFPDPWLRVRDAEGDRMVDGGELLDMVRQLRGISKPNDDAPPAPAVQEELWR